MGELVHCNDSSLAFFEEARAAVAKAASVDEVKDIRDRAEALRAYTRQASQSLEMQNQCADIKLRAERRLGELLAASVHHQGGRPPHKRSPGATVSTTLDELGVSKSQSSRWQRIALIPTQRFEDAIGEIKEAGEELTTAGLLRAAARRHALDVMGSSESYEWGTPAKYVEAARSTMSGIDLDPATSEPFNEVVGAARILTVKDDGLRHPWKAARVFCNPPYGRRVGDHGGSNQDLWSAHALEQFRCGNAEQIILVLTAATHSSWFERLWSLPLCFSDHRVRFVSPDGVGVQPPPVGTVFVYLGSRLPEFISSFAEFGRIVVPEATLGVSISNTTCAPQADG